MRPYVFERAWLGWTSLLATLVAGAMVLCLPAVINGQPLLFSDTITYIRDGMSLVRLEWPPNQRPVFYGLAIWFLHWERTVWPIVFAQGLIVSHLIWLTLRVLDTAPSPAALLGTALTLAVATPLAWYVSHVMPDVFLGVLVLAMFLLGFCRDRLSGGETTYLVILAAAAICFHLSHLLLSIAIAAAAAAAWLVRHDWRTTMRPSLLIGPVALALAAYFSFSLVVYREVSLTPRSPPFLLARMLADGPAKAYLKAACEQTPYRVCTVLDQIPDTENAILWAFTPFWLPANADAIRAEAGSIITGTIRMFPGWVARNMLQATARQLITVDSGTWFPEVDRTSVRARYTFAGPHYQDSLEGRGLLDEGHLAGINRLHGAVSALSLIAAVPLAGACARRRAFRPAVLLAMILLSLLANAFITGGLAGVFGRYEGRGVWLLPFFVIAAGLVLYPGLATRSRRRAAVELQT